MIGQARIEHYYSLENTLLAYNSQDNYTFTNEKTFGKNAGRSSG